MKAEEFRKIWLKQFEDKPQPFDSFSESAIAFAEEYTEHQLKKAMKQIFDAYGIGFMGRAQFKHDFESWYEMESKNF